VIFQEFHQLGAPARHSGKGLGLGLAVVDRAAHLIGAVIEIDSVSGRGSRFSVTLPRQPLPLAPAANSAVLQAQAPMPVHGAVLVVEDDPAVRSAMSSLLASWQCKVIAVESTQAALDFLRRHGATPRVMIADYHLPGDDRGTDAVQAVRAYSGVATPALLMSSDRAPHIRAAARDAGVVLLLKPVAPSKLRATLTYLFSQAAALDGAP
jgi:CheY-like chemotaxis protein